MYQGGALQPLSCFSMQCFEQIFGVLKWKFCTLHTTPEYSMSIQARIPVALAALHNFNCKYKESKDGDGDEAVHNDGVDKPNAMRDQIAVAM